VFCIFPLQQLQAIRQVPFLVTMKIYQIVFFFCLLILLNSSCNKKDDFRKKYTGAYLFKTEARSWIMGNSSDTIVYFTGYISDSLTTYLKIVYAPYIHDSFNLTHPAIYIPGTIWPSIDNNGNLSYPEWLDDPHKSFSGSFNENGDLNITMSANYLGGGWANKIHAVKH
jgi:hypothetical protein